MNSFKKIYLATFRLPILHQWFLCTLLFSCFIGDANAQIDSIAKKRNQLSIGFNLAKEVSLSAIYSPRNNTLLGLAICYNSFIFRASANYVNRAVFEKQNYMIGDRDHRQIPISGFDLSVLYIFNLHKNRILHPLIGFNYRKSTVYGGWNSYIYINGISGPVYRTINFDDKFQQVSSNFGIYFSNQNKFGYAIYFPVGLNTQSSNNSHYLEQITVGGSSVVYETKKLGYKNGLILGLNISIFYNFKL